MAIRLAGFGRKVLLLEKRAEAEAGPYRVGEGLPGAVRLLLNDLGVWPSFKAAGHLPCHGNGSYWGSDRLQTTDFIRDPHGHGWHLDRICFDRDLRRAAEERGAELWCPATLLDFSRDSASGKWGLSVRRADGSNPTIRADFLVDASGRVGRLVRDLGVERRQEDELVAFHAVFEPSAHKPEDRSSMTLIEAVADGWWYTALLPGCRRLVAFFTDADDPACRRVSEPNGFDRALDEAAHIARLLSEHGYVRAVDPTASAAGSGRLAAFTGPGWLAVGDAATSFDPLSSQGIFTALHNGLIAADAIERSLQGQSDALEPYAQRVEAVYIAFLRHRKTFYAMERRFADRPFWSRRHRL